MDLLAPLGPVYQAGTLSGNPLAMAAGMATLGYSAGACDEVYPQLEATATAVADGVAAEAKRAGVPLTTESRGRDVDLVLHRRTGHQLRPRPRNRTRRRSGASIAPCWSRACGCRRRSLKRRSSARRTASRKWRPRWLRRVRPSHRSQRSRAQTALSRFQASRVTNRCVCP